MSKRLLATRIAAAIRFWSFRLLSAFRVLWGIIAWTLSPKGILLRVLAKPSSKKFLLELQSKTPKLLRPLILKAFFSVYSNPLRDQTAERRAAPGRGKDISRGLNEVNTSGEYYAPNNWPGSGESIGLIILPVIDWRFRWQRPQQMSMVLASTGVDVKYVNPRFTRSSGRYLQLGPRVEEWVLPGSRRLNLYLDRMSVSDVEKSVDFVADRLKEAPARSWAVVVQHPFWEPLALRLRSLLRTPVIFDCMDDNAGFSNSDESVREMELSLASGSDLVVCTSEVILSSLSAVSKSSALIRNGADVEHFGQNFDRKGATCKTVGYFGAIADWFDSELLAEIAQLMPEVRFELIGSTLFAELDPLKSLPNVHFLGEMPYEKLPQAISSWDCCVIPFKINSLTLATNPVKLYEMLAAGKPVVSVPLPELQIPELANLVVLADSARSFSLGISKSISENSEDRVRLRQDFAAQNTWQSRGEGFLEAAKSLFPKVSVVVVTYNNLALNRLCVESVLASAYPNLELIVVDNNSTDGSVEYLESLQDSRIIVVKNKTNTGYAFANNQGLRMATGEFLVLLNNDTVCPPFLFDQLISHLQNDPKLGLVGPVTNAIGNEARIPVSYFNVEDLPEWAELVRSRSAGELSEIGMLAFFCVAMRRETLEVVGLLDERFGIGMYEDDDYCRRVREAGLEVRLANDTFVHHWHHASFKLLGEELFLDLLATNKNKFDLKWNSKERALD